jgi:hypothetical protein
MDWLKFLKKFLRNLVVFTLGAGLVLGLFGFILSGKEGFINMAIWGLALGLIGSISGGLAMLINANYWTGFAGRYGEAEFKKMSEGEEPKERR